MRHALILLSGALLISACGASPGGDAEAPAATQAATNPAADATDPAPSAAPADAANVSSAQLAMDGVDHAFGGDNGRYTRGATFDAEGVEQVMLETYQAETDYYFKAELFVATGAEAEGEYALGVLGAEGVRNQPGRGQVMVSVPSADGRQLVVSGGGTLRLRRDGAAWVGEFELTGDGNFRPVDAAPVTGAFRIVPIQ